MAGDESEAPLLESKLYPATGTRNPLPRPRLEGAVEVLTGEYPVALIVAPAGYGKSTLMARWHAQLVERGVPCAWLSVDENDADKVRFIRHLLAAVHKAVPGIDPAPAARLAVDFATGVTPLMEA